MPIALMPRPASGPSTRTGHHEWDVRPTIVDPFVRSEREELHRLRSSGRVTRTTDVLARQLDELSKIRIADGATANRPIEGTNEDDAPGASHDFGCRWVFYPWTGHLVRTLPGELWRTLRADRNRYKLTGTEQRRLHAATVAVVGLSVGASVVQVLALEGTGGVLRLADPDRLEGSNCNRLRAPLWDLGVPKAVLAARMVWEVDPFRTVEVVPDGIDDTNVGRFLDGVDVLVEECDSFATKLLVRREARRRGIPVVMATSEAGILDVERFDAEPSRPLFHGTAAALESTDLAAASGAERIALALEVIGAGNLSDRSAASMIELDRTVSSWPQLAGEVVAGGAHAAVAVRRIVLGLPCPSGRYRIDLDDLLASGPCPRPDPAPTAVRSIAAPVARPPVARSVPSPFIEQVVAAATLTPSGGNAQPWRFEWDGHQLHVRLDRGRCQTAIDPARAGSFIALGAACENIAIASGSRGRLAAFSWFPDAEDPDLAACVAFESTRDRPDDCVRLCRVLPRRHTDRGVGDVAPPLSDRERAALHDAAAVHGAAVRILEDAALIEQFADVVGRSDRIRLLNPHLHREFVSELRWTEDTARSSGDGIPVASLGLEPGGAEVLGLLARPAVSSFLARHDLGARLTEIQRRTLSATTALVMVSTAANQPVDRLRGGRALQRLWLEATTLGLAVHPVTPLTLFGLLDDGAACLSRHERDELKEAADQIAVLFSVGDDVPVLVLRMHRGSAAAHVSGSRLPVHDVLDVREQAA
jgi:ThiF family